jgi:exodeoxyribonuclease VII large subunit
MQDLAALATVDVIVVARGGGSVMDLMAFSDETLCRTVALLGVPVIASVGHHTDRALIDDVAAASCSTPTHAAEVAVRVDVAAARAATSTAAERLAALGQRALVTRARRLADAARAPERHVARQRAALHQQTRELRAAAARQRATRQDRSDRHLLVLQRKAAAAGLAHGRAVRDARAAPAELRRAASHTLASRRRDLERLRLALAGHDPELTLRRGYALVEDGDGELVTTAARARAAGAVSVRFHDDRVRARIEDE